MEYLPAKHLLHRSRDTRWFGTDHTMNIYRGCCHGCLYCDSRSACYQNPDFDTVKAKADALRILRDDLARKVRPAFIATGAMSDPYNPFEASLQLTRHALELIDAYQCGAAIATKSDLIVRDRDILDSIARHSPVICKLTITTFQDGSRYVTGNRCERGGDSKKQRSDRPNLYDYKYKRCFAYRRLTDKKATRGEIGIPRVLNMYENYPFWFTLLTSLGFKVMISGRSSHELFETGIESIASENICYPAKLVHGHIKWLLNKGIKTIFYPCVSYEENFVPNTDNHYNCPVVAYYPELIAANVPSLKQTRFLDPYVGLWRHKDFGKRIAQLMHQEFGIPKKESAAAARAAYEAYEAYVHDVRATGKEYIDYARSHGLNIIVVCGRPYHIDPEINHGINDLITSFGFVLVTEDALSYLEGYAPRKVLNQWTFQSRMYNAARYVCTQPDMELIQLVSFGCGIDAITGDEMRSILEDGGKLYTQLKIDDISNLGAVKIRIRSLMAAIDARKEN